MPDDEFDVLGEDELALLTRRFERLHEDMLQVRQGWTLFRRVSEGEQPRQVEVQGQEEEVQ
jgi:hypothetical protein